MYLSEGHLSVVLNAQAEEIQNEEGRRDKTVATRVQPCLKETQWVKRHACPHRKCKNKGFFSETAFLILGTFVTNNQGPKAFLPSDLNEGNSGKLDLDVLPKLRETLHARGLLRK